MVILDDSEACRFEAIHCLLVMLTYLNFVSVGLIRSISSVILDSACARHAVYHDLTKHQPWPTEKTKTNKNKARSKRRYTGQVLFNPKYALQWKTLQNSQTKYQQLFSLKLFHPLPPRFQRGGPIV